MPIPTRAPHDILEPSKPELLTMEDVERIIAQRLHWYGLDHFAIQSVERLADHRIEAKIFDLDANQSYSRIFDIHPALSGTRTAAPAIAA